MSVSPTDHPHRTLVILFGPPAVGKMAVGMELSRLTGIPLFHNHMSIEPVLKLFPYGSPPFQRLVGSFREHVFDEVARSDLPGLIFTYVWALDEESDRRFIDEVCARFEAAGAATRFVELVATQEARLRRNRSALRLAEKPSKRNVEASERRLLEHDRTYRMNTDGDFFYPDRHLRVDTTGRTAEEVAEEIRATLSLRRAGAPDPQPTG